MSYETIAAGRVLTREQVRQVDLLAVRQWGFSGLVLMENAGRGVADVLCSQGVAGPVVVCCAGGNNGGDGFVLARHLQLRGQDVTVVLCCPPGKLQGDARVNYDILQRTDVPVVHPDADNPDALRGELAAAIRDADWVVDALLGTGATGPPRPPLDVVIQVLNRTRARKLAIDIPSGLDCDKGTAQRPTFRADHTCTFVAAKPGLVPPPARTHVGVLHVLDIGVPLEKITEEVSRS